MPQKDTRNWSSIIKPPSRPTPRVVIIKKPGLWTYEKAIEEFRNRVRGEVQMISANSLPQDALLAWLARYRPSVIFAVGQAAYDLVRQNQEIPVVHAFVFQRRNPCHHEVPVEVPVLNVLRAFQTARPDIRTIGVVHGPATDPLLLAALAVASGLNLKLVVLRATSPTHAVSLMRKAIPRINGLWLLPDMALMRPQVFQYALVLQSRLRIPLMGITRRHSERGALMAMDYDPNDVGRQAALMANQIMAGHAPSPPAPLSPQLTINQTAAQGLGAQLEALRRKAVKVFR